MESILPVKPLRLNRLQATAALLESNIYVEVAGRGTGKTFGKALRFRKIVETMPGSCNAIYTRTFKSLLTNTISPVLDSLGQLGYYRDTHYVLGEKPPKDWKIAPNAPGKFEYYLSFRNGTGWRFMSEDREDSFRGPSVDSVDADEGLILSQEKFQNGPVMANRGNLRKYQGNNLHHGISISSSMPVNPKGKWILKFGDYYEQDGNNYWQIWNKIVSLQYQFLKSHDPRERKELVATWLDLQRKIKFYKKVVDKQGTTQLFLFGNVFDNISVVGLKYIEDSLRIMTPAAFCIEMLNERLMSHADCFYNINEDVHLYDAVNYSFIDSLGYDFTKLKQSDSRQDSDVDTNRPIDIAIDFGSAINGMRCGQEFRQDTSGKDLWNYRFVNTFYVKPPEGSRELIDKFCRYYQYQNRKKVFLYHDHTAVGGEGWRVPHISDTMQYLKDNGWEVETVYIGKAPHHASKHHLWYLCLSGKDPRFPHVRFNRSNDREGILSMQLAGTKEGSKGISKDKDTERSKTIPREQATDLSDAGDLLLFGRYGSLMTEVTTDIFGLIS